MTPLAGQFHVPFPVKARVRPSSALGCLLLFNGSPLAIAMFKHHQPFAHAHLR
ncbi:hypothetical protein [Rhodoferax sp. UBA5149]|uniref:hypothetical protein n=1 Tax=Rhodoferax sp. UBA5149 TaxID=1947379 RepID=UPI0025E8DB12|nr:hypothetical protein [Rhodoferax sp. UBA5149]